MNKGKREELRSHTKGLNAANIWVDTIDTNTILQLLDALDEAEQEIERLEEQVREWRLTVEDARV